jgi:DNA processing protein
MSLSLPDLLLLSRTPGIGSRRLRALIDHFGDPRAVAAAPARQLIRVEGIERKTAITIVRFFQGQDLTSARRDIDIQLQRLHRDGGRIITIWEDEYPSDLKRIYDPPALIFVKGAFQEGDEPAIAIVGTRNPTSYGKSIAETFSAELARSGLTIVSGLARGIDTVVHSAALRAGGRTLAVIGSGLDVIYPSENKVLAASIAEHGAIITEHEMGAKPDAVNFPRRNRIISGMALGTLVVETGVEGGAMITAAIALDQNREVFAIPSAVSERRMSGTNRLIKEGKALLTESPADILTELSPRLRIMPGQPGKTSSLPGEDLSLFERRVYDALDDQPLHIDQIAARTSFPAGDALVHLLSLEFKGLVVQKAGKIFVKL